MLLNQQSPATIERLLAYYQYLNNARMASINELQQTLSELEAVHQAQTSKQAELNKLVIEQRQQAKALSEEQTQRQHTLAQLQRTLNTRGEKLEQLQIEEASLKRVVEQALKAMQDSPAMEGLSSKNKLNWLPKDGFVLVSVAAVPAK